VEAIHHDHQFHKIVVTRRASRLDDEDVFAANVFCDLYAGLAVTETAN
jgi:hypothetical protein